MAHITCPYCGRNIDVDPSSVEDIARQLRDELFEHDLEARLAEVASRYDVQVEKAREEERRKSDQLVAQAKEQLVEVKTKLENAEREQQLALEREKANASKELANLQAKLDAAGQSQQIAVQEVQADAAQKQADLQHEFDAERLKAREEALQAAERAREREAGLSEEIARLKTQLDAQEETLKAQSQAELVQATSRLERSCNELETKLELEKANSEKAQADLREQMARREKELQEHNQEQLAAKDERIAEYQDDIKRLREYRMSLSTKMIGESLERHCENEFNRIRMQAYPRATFKKDNEVVGGTKGDFIFRDYDENNNELLSIMFEMKNEEEQTSTSNRKRNEDHFSKLDKDRKKKNCEYAVLVSTLEPENDFYNAGIADVSWQYPKMFVVRPQCFTTIIGLLKAAALAAHPYKLQLEHARREEVDVTNFEDKLTKIVTGIENDYTLASKNYEQAAKDIDAIIKKLEHLRDQLGVAAKHFGTAKKRSKNLTVKSLTWGNQTMKAAFAEAHEAQEQARALEDLAIDPDEPISPDAME